MTEHTIAGQMQWTAALVDIWAKKGRPPTDDMRVEARDLLRALRAAHLVDDGDSAGTHSVDGRHETRDDRHG